MKSLPTFSQIANLYYLGRNYIDVNQVSMVNSVLQHLDKLVQPNYQASALYVTSSAFYCIGQLLCKLVDYDNAIINLRKARSLGLASHLHNFHYDRNLEPLFERADFQELIKLHWPVVEN